MIMWDADGFNVNVHGFSLFLVIKFCVYLFGVFVRLSFFELEREDRGNMMNINSLLHLPVVSRALNRLTMSHDMIWSELICTWSEFTEELFFDDKGDQTEIPKPIKGPPVIRAEIEKVISDMSKERALRSELIPPEIFVALIDRSVENFANLLYAIYDTGNIARDMMTFRSTFITLLKKRKPGTTDCEYHRSISLMEHTQKLLL